MSDIEIENVEIADQSVNIEPEDRDADISEVVANVSVERVRITLNVTPEGLEALKDRVGDG